MLLSFYNKINFYYYITANVKPCYSSLTNFQMYLPKKFHVKSFFFFPKHGKGNILLVKVSQKAPAMYLLWNRNPTRTYSPLLPGLLMTGMRITAFSNP